MSPRLLRYHQLDLAAWDACVASAAEVVPYAQSWWLHATAGRWDALVTQEPHTGRYLSVVPLPYKYRLWGRTVVHPLFTQQLGQLSDPQAAIPPVNWPVLARQYPRFATQLNTDNPVPPPAPGITVVCRPTYHLSLEAPYATLQASYKAYYRRRLRRHQAEAAPEAVQLGFTTDAEPLLALFQATQGPAAGLRRRHYQPLRRLIAALQSRQLLEIREARHPTDGALLAGVLFVRYRSRLIYLFAAASAAGKQAAAPLLLIDAAIQHYAGTPGLVLDFEGGSLPTIARFFANFGAHPVCYATVSSTQRPWYLQWMP